MRIIINVEKPLSRVKKIPVEIINTWSEFIVY